MSTPTVRLSELLGGPPPGTVSELGENALTQLADLIEAARAAQDQSIEQSLVGSVKHVPLPLRGLAKRVLLG